MDDSEEIVEGSNNNNNNNTKNKHFLSNYYMSGTIGFKGEHGIVFG